MDATITDSAECKCQKTGAKYLARYALSLPYQTSLGLIASADTPVLLYRLSWPMNLTRWDQIVDGMKCTGGTPRLDRALDLANRMYTKAGIPKSRKTLGIVLSKNPTVSYTNALTSIDMLNVNVVAGILLSSSLTIANVAPLAVDNPILTGTSYCASLNVVKAAFPL